jgi:hypothetical protein
MSCKKNEMLVQREHSIEDLSCLVLVVGACYFIQIFWWFTPYVLSSVHFCFCLAATNSYVRTLLLFLCIPCICILHMLCILWSSKTVMKKIVAFAVLSFCMMFKFDTSVGLEVHGLCHHFLGGTRHNV